MNLKNRMILEDYRKSRDAFVKLGDIVHDMLSSMAAESGVQVVAIEHRVKSEESLAGKLARSVDYYQAFEDITDILGARVICFFEDEVDVIGKLVEKAFVIDWENSSDKRALIKADTFGYLSLHYICSLPLDAGYPDEVCEKRFEIQIRTNLQHTWSAINHDLGYKSKFGVPREVTREFARLAGLLEIADDEFVRVRDSMRAYTEETRKKIAENRAENVTIDRISLREYISLNKKMREFLEKLAAFSGAEISWIDPEGYIEQLMWLHKKTLGDLQNMLEENGPLALALAERALRNSELDILASSVGLRYLCRAELLNKGYTKEQAAEFLQISVGNAQRAERQAKYLYDSWHRLKDSAE